MGLERKIVNRIKFVLLFSVLFLLCLSISADGISMWPAKLEITLSDNGIGMSEETRKNAINPFFTTKDPGEGTGLGLAISYNIIKDHQGNMVIESEKNRGTRVVITLPLIQLAVS